MIRSFFKIFYMLLCCMSITTFAEGLNLLSEVKNGNGSKWSIEKNDKNYILKYINTKGVVYSNSTIVTSDVEGSDLSLGNNSVGDVSIIMNYPRDLYEFKFSSGDKAFLLSACKQIRLPSTDAQQAVALLTLCSKSVSNLALSNVDADKLLSPDNLVLNGKVKTTVGNNKAFLYDENGEQRPRKPYLIKGDDIEVLDYKNSFLKVKYMSKNKEIIAWIKFSDVL